MTLKAMGQNIILNGELVKLESTKVLESIKSDHLYEVIRVIEGVPLFFEEHFIRMKTSSKLLNIEIIRNQEETKGDIIKLIEANRIENENIKLIATELKDYGKVFLICQIHSFYPEETYYNQGVHAILVDYERENPNAKLYLAKFKEQIKKQIEEKQAFEALLVNESGNILEGSRSNIFFVRGDKIYTAKGKQVLLGITRLHILKICNKFDLELIERNINKEEIIKMDAAFMTGTSVDVLPISSIDWINLESTKNPMVRKIKDQYRLEMNNYILANKNKWE